MPRGFEVSVRSHTKVHSSYTKELCEAVFQNEEGEPVCVNAGG